MIAAAYWDIPTPPSEMVINDSIGYGFKWGEYTYWTYDFVDNSNELGIVAYDEKGAKVRQWVKSGGRYISNIQTNDTEKTITFEMRQYSNITLSWSELQIR